MAEHPRRATLNATGLLGVVAGAVLFALVLWNAGPSQVWSGVSQLRWWLGAIVALGGLRFLTRAAGWSVCVEPPHRLPLREAFAGVITGDTVGNATPLGPVLGEPAKAAYVRGAVPTGVALTALAIETLFYTLSAAGVIAAGTLAFLAFNPPAAVRQVGEAAILAVIILFATALVILWRRPALISGWLPFVARRGGGQHASTEKVRALEHQIYTFAARRPGAVATVVALECLFHALGVLEVHLTLTVLTGAQPPLLSSFILETAHRLMAVVFKFVPFQLGVGEVGTAVVAEVLGLGRTTGVTLAVVRKARMAVWAIVGATLLARRGIRPRDQYPAPDVQ